MMDQALSTWMTDLPASLYNVPLCYLSIPGSHESLAYTLKKEQLTNFTKRKLGPAHNLITLMAPNIIYDYSITQEWNFTDQLKNGIRYFDLRVHGLNGDILLGHGYYGEQLATELKQINEFLENHPKEVIFLDINHCYDMNMDDHLKCLNIVVETFSQSKLCPRTNPDDVTLKSMWDNDYQVLLFYPPIENFSPLCGRLLWHCYCESKPTDGDLVSPWLNCQSAESVVTCLNSSNIKQQRVAGKFFVTQGVLTPDTGMIMQNLTKSLKTCCADKINSKFIHWLSQQKVGLFKAAEDVRYNIFVIDFANKEFVDAVLKLNLALKDELL